VDGVRHPAVAGTFYPAQPAVLARTIDELVAGAQAGPAPKAIIVPHAGYMYSGAIAASAFARIDRAIERVVIIGPAHRVYVDRPVWPGVARMETPLGEIEVDVAAIERAGFAAHPAAHAREHSIEVELPFVQKLAPRAKVVPLVVSDRLIDLEPLWGGRETLIAISSDLSHYLPYAECRSTDARTAEKILAFEEVDSDAACGAAGINSLSAIARKRGLRIEQLDLRNSGDTAGPRDRVVGYGAFALYEATR
jgi:AmmeMemoRadiSam system protein B